MNEYLIYLFLFFVLILGGGAAAFILFFRARPDLSLIVLGLLGWSAAGLFALLPLLNTVSVEVPRPNVTSGRKVEIQAANPAAAGASCGFAIGGGLCFLGAALTARGDRPGANA